jgi:hypothetical protein
MENILIIAYYYPPCKGVAVYRPLSWAKDFHKHGYNPTIITRHWTGNEVTWDDYLKECLGDVKITVDENSRVISLPYQRNNYVKFAEKKWVQRLLLDKLIYLFLSLKGSFQVDINAYGSFKNYIFKHLEKENYKLVIITSPPLNMVRLAFEINKKFKTPYVIDFQDSWNNLMLKENYHPTSKENFYNFLKQLYLKKWLKRVSFTTTVTPSIGDLIKKITKNPIEIITNGFEQTAYSPKKTQSSNTFFNVSVMGTIHPIQDVTIMIEGLNLFLKGKSSENIRLNFIGLDSIPEMAKRIKASLPSDFLYVSQRVSMEKAVELTLAANVLLFPSYKGYKGYYTAKIFEYLGAERNILMVPGNGDIVDDLIIKTQSGKIANSGGEFKNILENWFLEWKQTGTLTYHGIKEEVNFFSRENQNKLLCEAIKKYVT